MAPWRKRINWSTEANQTNGPQLEMDILWNLSPYKLDWFEKLKQIIKCQNNNEKGNQNN
jgi:hypothetical protein